MNLIGNSITDTGLRIQATIYEDADTSGIKVSDEEVASLAIERDAFHGEWNCRLIPRSDDKYFAFFKFFFLASLACSAGDSHGTREKAGSASCLEAQPTVGVSIAAV